MNLDKTPGLTHAEKDAKIKELDKHFCWALCWIFVLVVALLAATLTAKVKYDSAAIWEEQAKYEFKQQRIRAQLSDSACVLYPAPDSTVSKRIKELERQQVNYEFRLIEQKAEVRVFESMYQQCESKFNVIKGMVK